MLLQTVSEQPDEASKFWLQQSALEAQLSEPFYAGMYTQRWPEQGSGSRYLD